MSTSKERVRRALLREQPDRPPLGFFAIDSDTAEKVLGRPTYWRAKAKCKIALWEGRRDEVVQSLIADGIELYRKLDIIDIVSVFTALVPPQDDDPDPPRKIDDVTWQDKAGRVYRYSPVTQDITMIHDPEAWTREFNAAQMKWDGRVCPPDEREFEAIDAIIAALGEDRFMLGTCAPPGSGWLLLGGMERGLLEIASAPDNVKDIYESQMARARAHNRFYVRPGQDGVLLGDDYASAHGPMVSPAVFRNLFLHAHAERIAQIKGMGLPVVQHACGNNWKMLDIFVDMGIDCYQSIQESATMDIVEVQRQYGSKFAVWGGVRVEHLVAGTPQDVRRDVRRFMREVAPQGGCVMGTTHSVAVGTRYDNFMAMLDEFCKCI